MKEYIEIVASLAIVRGNRYDFSVFDHSLILFRNGMSVPVFLVPILVVSTVLRELNPHARSADRVTSTVLGLVVQVQVHLRRFLGSHGLHLSLAENLNALCVHDIDFGNDFVDVDDDVFATLKEYRLDLAHNSDFHISAVKVAVANVFSYFVVTLDL